MDFKQGAERRTTWLLACSPGAPVWQMDFQKYVGLVVDANGLGL